MRVKLTFAASVPKHSLRHRTDAMCRCVCCCKAKRELGTPKGCAKLFFLLVLLCVPAGYPEILLKALTACLYLSAKLGVAKVSYMPGLRHIACRGLLARLVADNKSVVVTMRRQPFCFGSPVKIAAGFVHIYRKPCLVLAVTGARRIGICRLLSVSGNIIVVKLLLNVITAVPPENTADRAQGQA